MKKFIDQMGRTVVLPVYPPRRIVSLVPSQTELLYDLELEAEVVGITKFCVHPESWFHTKKRVGGTKTVSLEKVEALSPDLIIGNKEENDQAQIEALAARFPVWMSEVYTWAHACSMIEDVGYLTGKPMHASLLYWKIKLEFEQNRAVWPSAPPRVAYFIWRKPYMVAGGNTFINSMLEMAGFDNVFKEKTRYPEIALNELQAADPDLIFLASEPFPFSEKHFTPFQKACPRAKIQVVDGKLFSWYGSSLLQASRYFKQLRDRVFDEKV